MTNWVWLAVCCVEGAWAVRVLPQPQFCATVKPQPRLDKQ